VTWSPETLSKFLARPSQFIPGNRMVFIGVGKPQDRANLIAFLQQATGAN
jgi:cytochrome c